MTNNISFIRDSNAIASTDGIYLVDCRVEHSVARLATLTGGGLWEVYFNPTPTNLFEITNPMLFYLADGVVARPFQFNKTHSAWRCEIVSKHTLPTRIAWSFGKMDADEMNRFKQRATRKE